MYLITFIEKPGKRRANSTKYEVKLDEGFGTCLTTKIKVRIKEVALIQAAFFERESFTTLAGEVKLAPLDIRRHAQTLSYLLTAWEN